MLCLKVCADGIALPKVAVDGKFPLSLVQPFLLYRPLRASSTASSVNPFLLNMMYFS